MNLITGFSLRNAAVVVLIAVLITAGGLYSASELQRETMPDVTIPIVAIITPYPGAAPADVADKVTGPMESAIMGVPGVKGVDSVSNDSVSIIVAEFGYSQDMEKAESGIQDALGGVELPETALEPITSRVSMGSQPILRFAISGQVSAEELQAAVLDRLVPAIESIDGVGEVNVANEHSKDVYIRFDPDRLEEEGLTEQAVIQQLQAANLSFPVGSVELGGLDQPLRVSGTLSSVESIREFNVAVYPDSNKLFADAFEAVGDGMGTLGRALGLLGDGVGQLGGAVGSIGEGTARLGADLGMQVGLSSALSELRSQISDVKVRLSSTDSILRDLEAAGATATPEYAEAQAAKAELEATLPALDAAAAQVAARLADAQKAAAGAGASAPRRPQASAPKAGALPGPPAGSAGVSMKEPSIGVVRLGDVAAVSFGTEADAVYSRANGQPAVLISVVKSQDANTVSVVEEVRETIDDVVSRLPAGSRVDYTYDGSVQIERSISDMLDEGYMGAALAFVVILLFLQNWRSTLIAAISIPMSIVFALLFMRFADVTMNVMTLGGLTVSIGRVVDDSIVVIENIYNHLQAGAERTPEMIQAATREVSGAITSSTLATMAVFAPMTLVSGIVGKVFTPFAITVALALLASLIVSVTIVPLLAKWSLLRSAVKPRDERVSRTSRVYRAGLEWSLDHPGVVMTGAALIFAGSVALLPMVGAGFMPPATEKFVSVDVSYPSGTSPLVVDEALQSLESSLRDDPDVELYTANVAQSTGFNVMQGGATGGNAGNVFLKLNEEADVDQALKRVHQIASPLKTAGAKVTVSQVSMAGGSDSSIEVVVTGREMADVERAAEKLLAALGGLPGLENVTSNIAERRPQVTTEVDQAAAASHGMNAGMVAGAIRGYVAHQSAGSVRIEGRDAELLYITELKGVSTAADIADRTLTTPLGDDVRIGQLATVEQVETPVSIYRFDGQEYAAVTASITDRDTSSVITAVEKEIAALDLPDGVEVELGGVANMMSESFRQLGLAMLVAVAAVYLVMMLAFGEAIAPLAIMFSLPLAVVGGFLGLLLAGIPLDMPAMIGALMLIGIVTTNAIMLIERVHQKLAEGMTRREALLDAGTNRWRPILMTALTTIFALFPMAFGIKEGGLMSQSLAIVVVGGLTSSTLLTLIVVPVVYDLLEGLKQRVLSLGGGEGPVRTADV